MANPVPDPMTVIQAQRAAVPRISEGVRPIQEVRHPEQQKLLSGRVLPNDPRIMPPDPDPEDASPVPDLAMMTTATPATAPVSTQDMRVLVSFGPESGQIIVAIEHAPHWDVAEGEAWVIPVGSFADILPILRALTRVKDMTGGAWRRQVQGP